MQSTSRAFTAERFLLLLKEDEDRTRTLERYYVKLAFQYGVDVYRIASLSGLPLERVQILLLEED